MTLKLARPKPCMPTGGRNSILFNAVQFLKSLAYVGVLRDSQNGGCPFGVVLLVFFKATKRGYPQTRTPTWFLDGGIGDL